MKAWWVPSLHRLRLIAITSVVAAFVLIMNLRATADSPCSDVPTIDAAAAQTIGAGVPAHIESSIPDISSGPGRGSQRDGPTTPARTKDRPPNVLVIVTDDQRIGSLSVMPQTRRWMSRGGTKFTNAFVTTPLCCPSRTSILTGRYAHNHGVHGNEDGVESIFPASGSLEHYLHEDGYRTGLFGKFLNGWPLDTAPPDFDRWAFFPRIDPNAYQGGVWNVNGRVRTVPSYATSFIRRHALSFLDAAREKDDRQPWFLYLATPAPHFPAIPAPRYAQSETPPFVADPSTCESDRSDKPSYVQGVTSDLRAILEVRRRMLETLMSVDDLVGTVFRTLRSSGELRNTLAIFVSDNGYLWGEHALTEKGLPYTPSIQVPMVLRWPGHFTAGSKDHRLAANIDLAPTILEAAGIEPDSAMDGRSLLEPSRRSRLLTESWKLPGFYVPTWASLRTKTYQYIEYYGEDGSLSDREFYDLVADPWQLGNLLDGSDPEPREITRLHELLAQDRSCVGASCP